MRYSTISLSAKQLYDNIYVCSYTLHTLLTEIDVRAFDHQLTLSRYPPSENLSINCNETNGTKEILVQQIPSFYNPQMVQLYIIDGDQIILAKIQSNDAKQDLMQTSAISQSRSETSAQQTIQELPLQILSTGELKNNQMCYFINAIERALENLADNTFYYNSQSSRLFVRTNMYNMHNININLVFNGPNAWVSYERTEPLLIEAPPAELVLYNQWGPWVGS